MKHAQKSAVLSRSILDFFPLQSSHLVNSPVVPSPAPTQPNPPICTWRSLLSTESKYPVGAQRPDLYFTAFQYALGTVVQLASTVLTEVEKALIGKFQGMSIAAKILCVRLWQRRGFWYYLEGLEYEIDAEEAGKELMAQGFALGIHDAILEGGEVTYELLKSLKKKELLTLMPAATSLLVQLTGEDHTTAPITPFPRPERNPIYSLYRLVSTSSIAERLKLLQVDLSEDFQLSNTKPKGLMVAYIYELICGIKAALGDVQAAWRLDKRKSLYTQENAGNLCINSLLSADFPALIAMTRQSQGLFQRVLALFCFFHPNASLEFLALLRMNSNYSPPYQCSASSIFQSGEEVGLAFDAFLMEKLLDSLTEYKHSKEIEGQIVSTVSEIALSLLTQDDIGYILTLESFLLSYTPPSDSAPWEREYSSQWRWTRVAHRCLAYLEKAKCWSAATVLTCNLLARPCYYQRRGAWWERLILDTHRHLKDAESAQKIATLALADCLVRTGKRVTIEKHAIRLGVQTPQSITPTSDAYFTQFIHPNYKVVTITGKHVQGEAGPLYIGEDSVAMRVEDYAIWWYSQQGWKGFHCENSLFRALYGILLWPVLYSPAVPGAFQHNYQSAALDYKSCSFYSSRKSAFDQEFDYLLEVADLRTVFLERFSAFQGFLSAYVDWDEVASWGLANLVEILAAIDRTALINIFETLAKEFKFTNHGLPDLLLWQSDRVLLVEVKSANDRLADHQKLWIERLAHIGVKVELLHVLNG